MVNVNSRFYSISCFTTLLNSLSAKPLLSKFSSVTKIFYEQSLLFAINNQAIQEKFQQYKDLSWAQKFKIGVIKGGEKQLVGYLIIMSLELALTRMASGNEAGIKGSSELPSILEGLAFAVVEEVLFRGILQNCVAGSQKIATCITPQCLQNNCVFKWLTSPSARIISINAMFAGLHLFNGGLYLSDKSSLIQASRILLQPTQGILHETTGNIIAPIACHMTNNFLALSIANFFSSN